MSSGGPIDNTPESDKYPHAGWRLRFWPYLLLLLEVLIFYRAALFLPGWSVPWDFRGYHLPHAALVVQSLRMGEWPLWNPYIYCGHPFAANIQTGLFYPPRILTVALGLLAGSQHVLALLEWELALHVYLAAVFTYWCGRRWGLNREGALLSATVFALGGYFASQAEHIGAVETAAWLPVMAGSLVLVKRGLTLRPILEMAGAFAMATLAGFTPLLLVLYFSVVVIALLLALHRLTTPRVLVSLAIALALACLLSAIVLIPAAELTRLSVAQYRADWRGTGGGIPTANLVSLVWPNLFHILERGKYSGHFDITFSYLYSGLIALVLAAAACVWRPGRLQSVLILLAAVSGVGMLGDSTAIGARFFLMLPTQVRGVVYPDYWLAVFLFSLAMLSGFGLQSLVSRRGLALGLALAAGCELIVVSSSRPFNIQSVAEEPGVTEKAFDGSQRLLDTVRQAVSADPPYRVDTYKDSIAWAESASVTSVPSANGYDPLALVRFMQVRLAFCRGQRWGAYYQVDDPASPLLGLLNVRCLISHELIPEKALSGSNFLRTGDLPGHFLYENLRALPRFFLVSRTTVASSATQANELIRSPNWRPSEEAIVEAPQAALPTAAGTGTVRVVRYGFNQIELAVSVSSPAFLASSETHYPGWHAFVDGLETPIYFTDLAFRGIVVPAGGHTVRFRFKPLSVIYGAAITALALLVYACLWVRQFSSV